MKDYEKLVATAPCNCTQPVSIGSVAVLKSESSATGCGPIASKEGQKTKPHWTLKLYLQHIHCSVKKQWENYHPTS